MNEPMTIVSGENIPFVEEAFGTLGPITFLPGRTITSKDLKGAKVLLVRSITHVNEALLRGTAIEFVGSASAGVDHIDEKYLKAQNIDFAAAPGSNANSVAEYIIVSLLIIAKRQGISLSGKTIAIVGVGNIGRLVKKKAEALGLKPVLYDPPLADLGRIQYTSFEEALGCDVVTLHVPLTFSGPYPTYHMLNDQTLKLLKPSAIFLNAARGEVVDSPALLKALQEKRIGPVVLDVWENEPNINWDLFQAVPLGTPHIAGHSLDGKANGTNMIYTALCRHFGREPIWNPSQSLPEPIVPSLKIDARNTPEEDQVMEVVTTLYDLEADYQRMKQLLDVSPEERPICFDNLRRHYPVRREFHRTAIMLPGNRHRLRQMLAGLGFMEISEQA